MLDNLLTPAHLLVLFVFPMILVIIPFWQIWKKAGFSPLLSIVMMIPLVGIIMLYVLAFSEWKVVPASRTSLPPQPPQG